jgi:uncharacterized protein (TIGR02145 family)
MNCIYHTYNKSKNYLKTTKLNDNTPISLVTPGNAWANLSTPAYCWYNSDISNKSLYGGLYNWYTVNTGKLCPNGWHVPSDLEYKTLELFLGLTQDQADNTGYRGTTQGLLLKSSTGWSSGSGNNNSGFTALPGGIINSGGTFEKILGTGVWWCSNEASSIAAWDRYLSSNQNNIGRDKSSKNEGFSVRCLRDN